MFTYKTIASMAVITVIAVVIFSNLQNLNNNNTVQEIFTENLPQVSLFTPGDTTTLDKLTLIGEVVASEEAFVTPQAGGKIEIINIKDGDFVTAGEILIQLENSQQRATLRQAEAGLQQAQTSLPSAETNTASRQINIADAEIAVSNAKNRINTVADQSLSTAKRIILNDIDPFYSRPRQGTPPGVRIGVGGDVQELNQNRIQLRTLIPEWEESISKQKLDLADYLNLVNTSINSINIIQNHLNLIETVLENETGILTFTNKDIQTLRSELTQRRDELTRFKADLENAMTSLITSNNNLAQARVVDTNTQTEQALSQIKQAEATLAGAQANLAQTILRAPISGTITELNATRGATVSAGTKMARIVAEGSFEIEVYVSPQERQNLSIGDQVEIQGVGEGKISRISPTVDSSTQKQKIMISTGERGLTIGNTVQIKIEAKDSKAEQTDSTTSTIRIPITAVQFNNEVASVLTVDDNNKLHSVPITINRIRNSLVEVVDGIDANTLIVKDARGLRVGAEVEVQDR